MKKWQFNEIKKRKQKKEVTIKSLEMRNTEIKYQLSEIDQFLKYQKNNRKNYDSEKHMPKKDYSFQSSQELQQKQLENVYKKIYFYEKQIKRKQEVSKNLNASSKIQSIYNTIKEQENLQAKLKKELYDLNKSVNKLNKDLKNVTKDSKSQKVKNLIGQIQYLQQRIKQMEASSLLHKKSMDKQKQYIKTIEVELLELGISKKYILEIRQKIGTKKSVTSKTESSLNTQQMIDSSFSKGSRSIFNLKEKEKKSLKKFKTEDCIIIEEDIRTQKKYDKMVNQIKLLQKISGDEAKLIETQSQEYKKAALKNKQIQDKIQETQDHINRISDNISQIRSSITADDLKPRKYFDNFEKQTKKNSIADRRKKRLAKITGQQLTGRSQKEVKKKTKIQEYDMMINKNLKYDEAGYASEKGIRFTDRNVLGHNSPSTYMNGIQIYWNKNYNIINGIKILYNKGIEGNMHIVDEDLINEESIEKFKCIEGQFIKNISGSFNMNNQLESITVLTTNSRFSKFGKTQKTSNNFVFEIEDDEYPICLFGSIYSSVNQRQMKYIQSIGVEIIKEDLYLGIQSTKNGLISNEFVDP